MVRDLVELGVDMVREERLEDIRGKARAERRGAAARPAAAAGAPDRARRGSRPPVRDQPSQTRERLREQLRAGRLDTRVVEIEVREKSFPSFEIIAGSSVEEIEINLKDMLPGMFQGKTKKRRMKVPEALEYLAQEEEQKLIDMDSVARTAVERVEQAGIIFIDEIDKIAGREGGHGPDVSREGVQRDILPIVEGTTVNTKYGMVRTDHILFIAAGAFHVSKPSDLIPELQGRFPIRVELEALGKEEFVRILTEPKNALVKQYIALMDTEGITLTFTDDAIQRIAEFATQVNERTENIGARRLHTVMEKLLDEISFEGPDLPDKQVIIDDAYVDPHAGRHREERRSVPIHSVSHADAAPGQVRPRRTCRASLIAFAVLVACGCAVACGKEGPPLPPLVRIPAAPEELSAERRGGSVGVRLVVPSANTDGTRPADIERVDIYAVTGPAAPTDDQLVKQATRVGSVDVKAPRDPDATVDADEPVSDVDAPEGPGVDQGASASFTEQLTSDAFKPVDLIRGVTRWEGCRWRGRRSVRRSASTPASASALEAAGGRSRPGHRFPS